MDHMFTITPLGPFDFEPSSWPTWIKRFRLRLLKFNFNIIHVPCKNLITADTLSGAPLPATATEAELDLEIECKAYLDSVADIFPATPTKLEQIKSAQTSDDISADTLQMAGRDTYEMCMSSCYPTGPIGQSCMKEEDCS
ncbi:uncharacterized protein K02A2.6-like [Tachysurus ichikawai]